MANETEEWIAEEAYKRGFDAGVRTSQASFMEFLGEGIRNSNWATNPVGLEIATALALIQQKIQPPVPEAEYEEE